MCASAILPVRRKRDLAGEDRVVAGHVGLRVVAAMLVLDIHAGAKLLEIEPAPVDSDRVADAPRLLPARSTGLAHFSAALAVSPDRLTF
jgi:hypothetical protein